jgi:hypothetical protein
LPPPSQTQCMAEGPHPFRCMLPVGHEGEHTHPALGDIVWREL